MVMLLCPTNVQQLLAIDPRRRISCQDALEHPYLADMANAL
jgi:serine/threonine protein kinase